jgi:hypothetical protein
MEDPIPVPPLPQEGTQNNNWARSDEQSLNENPFIRATPGERTSFSPSVPKKATVMPAKKDEVKVEKKDITPSIFKGAYGAAKARLLSFSLGKTGGYKDFGSYASTPIIRQKMLELRDRLVPKGRDYIKQIDAQRELNKMKREMTYRTGSDRVAADKFFKEVETKTGLKPKPY